MGAPLVMEMGTGVDIRGRDWTKAACRAVHNALRHNSLSLADAYGLPREAMRVEIVIGAGTPDSVDRDAVMAMLPYGEARIRVERGGMTTPANDAGYGPIMANAVLLVSLDGIAEAGTAEDETTENAA